MNIFQKLEETYLIAPKILYFVVNLQYYTLHQFRSSFSKDKFKVTNSQYGKFTGIIMFVTFFTNIFIGGISDKTRRHKSVLLFLTIASTVVFMNFYISGIAKMSIYNFWMLMFLYLMLNNPKQPLLDKIVLDYLSEMPSAGPQTYGKQRLWGSIAYGVATFLCEWCLLENREIGYNYDNLIYYCLLTTIAAVLSIVFLIKGKSRSNILSEKVDDINDSISDINENTNDNINENTNNNINNNTNINTNDNTNTNTNTTNIDQSIPPQQNTSSNYMILLKNPEFIFFIFIMFSNAVTRSSMSIYLNIFQVEVLKIKPYSLPGTWPIWLKNIIGIFNNKPYTTLTIFGITFEILIMFISDGILNKMGLFWPLLLAQVFSLVRFFAYYSMSHSSKHAYALSCFFELIKGIYFGLAHISAVQIATRLAPANLKATSQMIYQGTFNALGSLISGYFFGMMFDSTLKSKSDGSKGAVFSQLFLLNGFISFVTILLYVYKYGIRDKVLFSREAEEVKLNAANTTITV